MAEPTGTEVPIFHNIRVFELADETGAYARRVAHRQRVLSSVLGMTAEQMAALRAAGVAEECVVIARVRARAGPGAKQLWWLPLR